jgi:hypothetical protein
VQSPAGAEKRIQKLLDTEKNWFITPHQNVQPELDEKAEAFNKKRKRLGWVGR